MIDIVITSDIVDYLGKYENGVLVLLSINFNDKFSEGTLYYSSEDLVLTVDPEIEKEIGQPIEFWPGYRELLVSILKRVVPYDEIINRLDEIDPSEYRPDDPIVFADDVNESEIISITQSYQEI